MKHAGRYSLPSNPESTARPSGRLRLWCGLAAGLLLCAATVQAGPATGKPTISGAPQVGELLTADTSGIEDTDGLGTFSYQWIQVDDLTETNILGATSSTYTPVAADIGKTLKVKVNFTDGEGNAETLTSDAYPSAGYPVVAIVAAKTTCPTDSDWCAELGVGYQGIFSVGGTDLYLGYDVGSGEGHLGTLSDTDVSHGESTYAFASIKFVSRSGISYVQVKLDGPMPMGTVFNLGGTTFTANPVDWTYLSPGNGEYKFITPSGFGMVEGQKMTVSVNFPADVTDNSGDVIDPPISSRTRAVKAAIVAASGVQTAAAVTAEHLANITTLDLSEKSITSLTAGDFNGLTQLVQLDLNNNDLSSLPSGIFSELTALKNLDLSDNRLSALPAGLFDDATALREVQLQFNELSTLPAGIFKNSSELRDFDVEQNNLTSLPADIFQDTPKLYRLFMRQNELESVSSDLVSGLSNLFLFHIGFNNLDSLPAGFFVGLTNLKWLYVMGSTSSYTTPFTVSLEKVEDGKVKAVIREGAPYDIQVHVTVENGSLADDATLIAIPQGVVESEAIAVTRTPGTTGAVTVDIERYGVTLPTGLPVHRGFELVKPTTGLPVEIYAEVALSLSTSSVDEDAGATSITVTGTLNGTTRTADTPVTVAVGTSSDTATEGTDYATVNDLTLTILAGETSGTASFTLTPTDDDVDEADETLSVSGTTTATDLSVTGTTATIVDDDERGVEVSATTLSVSEGGTATYTVALESKPTDTVTVALSASGDADVTVSPSSLSFITENWSTAQTVTVSAAPDAAARGDRAMIAHAASGGDYGSVSIDAVSVTVAPGQVTGVTVSAGIEELTVTWDAVSNADGYKVQWKSGSETFASAATDNREATIASGTTTSYAITGLTNGTAYSVQVIATRANSDDGTASAPATAMPVAQARITSVEFTNVPSSGVYGLGSTIEVSARFDAAVEVTGMPQIQLTFPSTTMSNKYVHYDDAASTDRVLVFKRLVTGDDDEEESGIRVDTNSLELNGGTIKSKGTSVNADISHSYVTGPNAKTRWVESIAVTSEAAAGRVYGPDEKIEFTVTFESPVYVDQTGGNPQLFFQARNSSTTHAAAYESGTGTKELVFAWTVPAAVADDGADLVVPSNVYNLSAGVGLHNDRGLVLNGGAIENRSGIAVNIRHEEHDLGVQVDTTTPVLASGADGATVDGTTLVLTFQNPNNSNLPDQLDENSVPTPTDFAVTVAGSAQTVSSVDVSGATVTLSLASPVGYAQTVTMGYTPGTNPVQDLAGNDAASIADHSVRNDSPQPSLSIQDATVAEDAGTAAFTVTLDVASGELVAVDYATADGTGAAGSDYTAASGTLTFAAGETTGTIEVAVADDAIDEEDESFTVTLSNPVTATIASATATGTITDDDTASTEATLSVSLVAMSEDAGATTVTVTAELDESARTSATEVTVSVGDSGDGATEGTDYATVSDFTLTIAAGQTTGTATFTLTPTDDDVDEEDETLTVDGTVQGLTVTATTLTIEDDDTRGIALSPTSLTVAEGGSKSYAIVLESQPTADVTVSVTVPSGTEVSVDNTALTFTTSNWDQVQTVTVSAAQDADAEDGVATITHAVSGGDYSTMTADDVAVTVNDDETASTKVTLSVSLASVSEDAGATTVTVTAELDEAPRVDDTSVTGTVGASGDSATEGTDYATVSDITLTIAAGQTSVTASFTLTPTDDAIAEEDETLTVDGTVQGLTVTATTLTIEDDDTRGIAVSPTNLTVAEGRSKSYTVVLSSQPTADVTVTPSVSGDSDVTVAPSKLTFTEDNWDQPQTVTVSAAQDADAEDASATIAHAVSGGDYGSIAAEDVEVTVTDDEIASTKVTLSVSATSVDEDAGSTSVTVTAELDESARTSATEVTVSVGAVGDGATEGTDYATVSDFTLTIAAGQTTGTASFTLTPTDDAIDEDDETLTVDGAVQGLSVTRTTLTIEDDDTRGIAVSSTDLTVDEGAGSSTYTVVLESQPTGTVTVTPSVSGDSDVTVAPSTLTFTEDNWDQPQTLTVSAAQDDDADDSSATITHAVSGGDYGSETADDVEVTVTDNDVVAIHTASITLCGATLGSTTGVAYDSSVDICWDTEGPIPMGSDVVIEERVKKFQDYPDPFSSWQEIARGNNFTPCSSDDNSCVKYTRTGLMRAESFTQELRIRRGSDVLGTSPQLEAAAPNSNENGLQAQLSQAIDEDTWAFIEKPTGPFVVGLVFSEPDLGALYSEAVRGLKTDDFRMTNGTVTAIEGWNGGSYKVRVTPTTLGEPVTIKLKAKTVRGVGEGITDAGKNAFTRRNTGSNKVVQQTAAAAGKVTATPGLSVADAEVDEGPDATLSFQVTLSRAASGSVAVDWATADGTATAGQDYTAARGTLTFASGETSQTVTVTVLDDAHNEGTETLTLTLSNPSGARITDGTATGTIINSDPMPQAWLARFGRTVADQVLTSVNNRARTARAPGFEARVAGQRLEGLLASDEEEEPEAARHQKVDGYSSKRDERGTWLREVTARDFVTGSSFALTGETQESGLGSLWGQGTLARFDGRKGDLSLDGEILSSLLGADWTRGRGIAGVLLSHAQGKGDGDGAMESTLTGLYPYGHYAIDDHLSAWSVFGYSRGELALVPTGGTTLEAGIGLAMAAAGARGTVLDGDRNGLTLALISDGMAMRTTSEAVEGLVSSEADVTRLRLGLEGSRPLRLEGGSVLTPAIEIGARHDGGDAETGYGADLGAALAWSYPKRGLKAKVQGRGLVAHQDSDFQEWGFAGSLAWDPTPASELGPSFTLQETVGAAATGGMRALMQRDSPADLTTNEVRGGGRVEAEIGYGLPVWRGRFAGIPSFRFGSAGGGRTARLGYRLSPISAEGWQLKLAVEAMRRKSANANRPTDHFVGMRAGMRW